MMCCGLCLQAAAQNNLNINYYPGDKTFFHSDYISDITNQYVNYIAAPKGNIINADRCIGRFDADRKDNYIYFKKINNSDCHIDISTDKAYPYYLIHARAKTDNIGANIRLCYIRDYDSNGGWLAEDMLKITPDGRLINNKNQNLMQMENGVFIDFAVAVDIENHKAAIYIDDKLVSQTEINSEIKKLPLVRFWIDTGNNGDLTLDKVEVTGMSKPYTPDVFNGTSVFHEDNAIKEYLKGKVAFHGYGKTAFYNGEKHTSETLYYDKENNAIYADCATLNTAYNIKLRPHASYSGVRKITYGGENLFEVKDLAEKLLKYNVFDDKAGMVITSKDAIELDNSTETEEYKINGTVNYPYTDIKTLNWYMAYQRPDASQILSTFNESGEKGHPRLLAVKSDFDRIRSDMKTDEYTKRMCDYLISKADSMLTLEPYKYALPDKQRITGVPEGLSDRIDHLAFAWQMTNDRKYVECAWKNLKAAAEFPDWNPSHIIDTAALTYAFAIAYDWMYDGFTADERNVIYTAATEKGLKVMYKAYYGRLVQWPQYANRSDGFVKWKSNFNTVVNGGVLAGAMAFMENDETFFCDAAEKAIRSLEFTMIGFAPDGAWIEGPGYWHYAMTYMAKGVGSLMTADGTDFGLMRSAGMKETAMFFRSMNSPLGCNNFHDTAPGRQQSPLTEWLAKVYNEPKYFAMRKSQAKNGTGWSVFDVIYNNTEWDDSEESLPKTVIAHGIESAAIRSSYADVNQTYFSAHGGLVSCYHSQADAGSFIYDVLGVRWATDLGSEDYNLQRDGSSGYYTAYRRRAEAHNVVVINPNTSSTDGGQKEDAFVPLAMYKETKTGTVLQYDMQDAYRDYTSDYTREFFIDNDKTSLVITDEITLKDSAEINWFMTTPAQTVWGENGNFRLTYNNKTVYGKAEITGGNGIFETTPCEPLLGAPVLEGQNSNSGYRRLRIYTQSSGKVTIRVTLSPNSDFDYENVADKVNVINAAACKTQSGINVTADCLCRGNSGKIMLIAAYKNADGELVEVKTKEVSPKAENDVYTAVGINEIFDLSENPDAVQAQILVLSDLKTLRPLSNRLDVQM